MYHNSLCCNSVRSLRFQGYGDCRSPGRSRRPFPGNKCDSVSPYGGLHGLSFDPTDTHALLCAVNALQSTKEPLRCPVRTSCSDSPRQSSSCSSSSKSCDSSDSLTAPSTYSAPIPCPCGLAQSLPVTEPVQACKCSCNSTTSSSQENSSQGMSQRGSRRGSVGVSVGVETSSKVSEKNREKNGEKKGLTWIDWGWPGTHDPCPFNQRHTVDDSLIRPEPVGFVTTKNVKRHIVFYMLDTTKIPPELQFWVVHSDHAREESCDKILTTGVARRW